jgi:hypothetical protein
MVRGRSFFRLRVYRTPGTRDVTGCEYTGPRRSLTRLAGAAGVDGARGDTAHLRGRVFRT